MASVTPNPVVIDDAELWRLVTTPRQRLFSSLNRASAFTPLIVVCCFLPAFLLLSYIGFNEVASLWGLRSMAVANATSLEAILQPGLNDTIHPMLFQPPLAAWLNGFVVRMLGPAHPLAFSLVSLVATGTAIWLITRCAWRIGGANTALISALLMCSHPQVLESAIVPTNTAIGICLFLASVFGLQRHLERKNSLWSPSLLLSSITWGLTLLAIGPIAFSLPLIFIILNRIPQRRDRVLIGNSGASQAAGCWTSKRSLLIFVVIGLVTGGGWELMMLSNYGVSFWRPWWKCLPKECLINGDADWESRICPMLQQAGIDWLAQSAMLLPWLLLGLYRSWRELCQSPGETAGRRYQLLLIWWSLTVIGRIGAEFFGMIGVSNTSIWNTAIVTPTVLLASVGFGSLSDRLISRRGETALMILIVGLIGWRLTTSWITGVLVGLLMAGILIFGPLFSRTRPWGQSGWTEKVWRQLLRLTVYSSLAACLSAGLGMRNPGVFDELPIANLKSRLISLPDVRRISLVSSRDPIPVALSYLLKCRWPQAELVTTEGWDIGMKEAMEREGPSPESRFLVLEWTRSDIRMSADASQHWQVTAVGEPMRFYGRRLSLVLIEPRS